ncbi:MAG: hypothetical protein J6K92_07275, partial [Oscillospiraceae bacterium]|nr:hypothetical protein [Oscillospiraceae bacterium]
IERENQRKRAELENARMQEQIAKEAKSNIPPLPSVEKLTDPIPEVPAISKPAPVSDGKKKAASEKPAESPKGIKSAKALTNELEDSFKALESIDSSKSDIKPLPKKPVFDFDDFDKAFSAAPKAEKPAAEAPAPKPKAEAPKKTDIIDLNDIDKAIAAMPKQTRKKAEKPSEPAPKPAAEVIPEPVVEVAPKPAVEAAAEPVIEAAPEPAVEAAPEPAVEAAPEPAAETAPDPVIEAVPEPVVETAPEPAPAPKPVRVNPVGKTAELSEFESAVMILKAKRDSGELSEEQYISEKKRLISTLY